MYKNIYIQRDTIINFTSLSPSPPPDPRHQRLLAPIHHTPLTSVTRVVHRGPTVTLLYEQLPLRTPRVVSTVKHPSARSSYTHSYTIYTSSRPYTRSSLSLSNITVVHLYWLIL